MRRANWVACWLGVMAATGCNKKSPDGLAPATEWQASPEVAPPPSLAPRFAPPRRGMGGLSNPHAADPSNPHAGLDMGGGDPSNPHAGLDMGGGDPSNPHAGLDMGGGDPSNPHAGLDMGGDPSNPHAGLGLDRSGNPTNPHASGGTDVTQLGLAAPDPDRPIDPSRRVTGTIVVDAKLKDRMKPGTAVFLIAKRAGPDGAPSGPALAVAKLSWSSGAMPFELSDAQAMVAGTELSGDVVVTARYDQDSDALSKDPGDVTGQVRVKIPVDGVKLALDTVLP